MNYRTGLLFIVTMFAILIGNVMPPVFSIHSQAALTAPITMSDESTPATTAASSSLALRLALRFGIRTKSLSSFATLTVISAFCASDNELLLTDVTGWVISAHF